jgi:hypothetical protein
MNQPDQALAVDNSPLAEADTGVQAAAPRHSGKRIDGFPDFFVVGAPRCGTTALCRYLARNPQICVSRPKEPHYFTRFTDFPPAEEVRRDYIDYFFNHRTKAHRVAGEGSVSYLYLPGVIENILHYNPEARFIVIVRNPLAMLPSYHLRMQYLLQEDEMDFEWAWQLQEARARGENVPKRCLDVRLLMYREVCNYGNQIEHLFRLTAPGQAHVIVFDDMMADMRAEYRKVVEFLGVDDDGQTEFESRNKAQMYRWRWLQQLFFLPVSKDIKKADILIRRKRKYNEDGSKKNGPIKWLTEINSIPMKPRPLSPRMRAALAEQLRPDVEHLSRLLQRDLGFWLNESH